MSNDKVAATFHPSLSIRLNEFKYWQITRRRERALLWFVWRLPKPVVYWCVVRAACAVEPQEYPGDKTAFEMMKALKPDE